RSLACKARGRPARRTAAGGGRRARRAHRDAGRRSQHRGDEVARMPDGAGAPSAPVRAALGHVHRGVRAGGPPGLLGLPRRPLRQPARLPRRPSPSGRVRRPDGVLPPAAGGPHRARGAGRADQRGFHAHVEDGQALGRSSLLDGYPGRGARGRARAADTSRALRGAARCFCTAAAAGHPAAWSAATTSAPTASLLGSTGSRCSGSQLGEDHCANSEGSGPEGRAFSCSSGGPSLAAAR
ncbi:unnamed protein product, partial [Prorocentrum cordatum]